MSLIDDQYLNALIHGDFETTLLRSAYSRIHDLNDPLRGPIFALLMRELIRIVMERLAPDDAVIQASWCMGELWSYKDKDDNIKVTRRSRYRFAVTGTISDQKISQYPKLDCNADITSLATLVDKLNKYTHVSPQSFNMTAGQTIDFLDEVESVVSDYARTLLKAKETIRDIIWTIVDESVNQHVMAAIPDELDALSGQTIVDNIHIEELQEFDTSTKTPILTGSGVAEIELNYGHGEEQMSAPDSYPLTFEVAIDPNTFEVSVNSVNVDTSSFYK